MQEMPIVRIIKILQTSIEPKCLKAIALIDKMYAEMIYTAETSWKVRHEIGTLRRMRKQAKLCILEQGKILSSSFINTMAQVLNEIPNSQIAVFVHRKSDLRIGEYQLNKTFKSKFGKIFECSGFLSAEQKKFWRPRDWYKAEEIEKAHDNLIEAANNALRAGHVSYKISEPFTNRVRLEAMASIEMGLKFKFNVIDATRNALEEAGIPGEQIVEYTSSVTNTTANANINKFMEGKAKAIITTIDKGGIGISLHDTIGNRPRVGVLTNLPKGGKRLQQIVARINRFGQRSESYFFFLASEMVHEDRNMQRFVTPWMKQMGAVVEKDIEGFCFL